LQLLSAEPLHLGRRPAALAPARRPHHEPAGDRRQGGAPLLAPHPPHLRPLHLPPHRLGGARPRPLPPRPARPPGGVRGRGPPLHLGQPLPRARAQPLPLRAGAHPRHLGEEAAPLRPPLHPHRDGGMVPRRLPPRRHRHPAHLLHRFPARPPGELGAGGRVAAPAVPPSYSLPRSASSSFWWMPPKPPLDMMSTTSPPRRRPSR